MRNTIFYILAFSLLSFYSCEDFKLGDEFIDQAPEVLGVTLDTVFSDPLYATQVLTKAYTSLPYKIPYNYNNQGQDALHGDFLDAITDLSYSTLTFGGGQAWYYNGALNSNVNDMGVKYSWNGESAWWGIRNAWIFVENVDKVPNMPDEDKARQKAEAKMVIATHYSDLFRHFGGLPWLDHAITVNEEFKFPRQTVETTVNNIVKLIDEAIPHLPWQYSDENDDGRMTKAYAMGLKLRVLLFAASPLFNDNSPYMQGEAADALMCWYGNKDNARWAKAKAAGEAFINELNANGIYDLVQANATTHEAYREAYRTGYFTRRNGEVLLSSRHGYKNNFGNTRAVFSTQQPTLAFTNMFPMADGSDFPSNFDWENAPVDPFQNRDPRFFETVLTNNRPYRNRTSELFIGGEDRKTAEMDGTGLIIYKFIQDGTDATAVGAVDSDPLLRLPEVFLSYAEAINEADGGPNAIAYEMVNRVRRRVGLSDLPQGLNQTQFREAVLRERACEFGYEDVRWFDITRWKMEDAFKAPIQGVNMFVDESKPTGFRYEVFTLKDRVWKVSWSPKWYLSSFPLVEINRNYGLVQNPGW